MNKNINIYIAIFNISTNVTNETNKPLSKKKKKKKKKKTTSEGGSVNLSIKLVKISIFDIPKYFFWNLFLSSSHICL